MNGATEVQPEKGQMCIQEARKKQEDQKEDNLSACGLSSLGDEKPHVHMISVKTSNYSFLKLVEIVLYKLCFSSSQSFIVEHVYPA